MLAESGAHCFEYINHFVHSREVEEEEEVYERSLKVGAFSEGRSGPPNQ